MDHPHSKDAGPDRLHTDAPEADRQCAFLPLVAADPAKHRRQSEFVPEFPS